MGLVALALFAFGFMGVKQLRKPPDIQVEPLSATPTPLVPTPSSEVVVHVVGAVKNPGLVKLPANARVVDAIAKRGGAKPNADLDAVNLAARLEDGTQLKIPSKGKVEPEGIAEPYRGGGSEAYKARPKPAPSGSSSASAAKGSSMVSLNTASQAQFESLPGIGPATAKKILEYRKAHGGFSSVDELLAVKGIGPKKLEAMRPFLKL